MSGSVLRFWKNKDSQDKQGTVRQGTVRDNPYTAEIVGRICAIHKIDESMGNDLSDTLGYACELYNINLDYRADRQTNKQVKKQLKALSESAGKLKRQVAGMHPQASLPCKLAYKRLQAPPKSFFRFEEIEKAVAFLEQVFLEAQAEVIPDAPGRLSDDALYVWVKTVSGFWVHRLGRFFSIDTHNQEPVTDVGKFLMDCLAPLDSRALPQLVSQMRRYQDDVKPPRKN